MDAVSNLEKMLGKKTTFEESVKKLTIMMEQEYTHAEKETRAALYKAVCRAATLLKSRYTAKSFWTLGARLFQVTSLVVDKPEERSHMEQCLTSANEFVGESDARDEDDDRMHRAAPQPFHFEGQLTSAPPPQPPWLVEQRAFLGAISAVHERSSEPAPATPSRSSPPATTAPTNEDSTSSSSTRAEAPLPPARHEGEEGEEELRSPEETLNPTDGGGGEIPPGMDHRLRDRLMTLMGGLVDGNGHVEELLALLQERSAGFDVAGDELRRLEEAIQASLADQPAAHHVRPPASKAEVQKLNTFEVTEEWLAKERGGSDTAPRCTICMEDVEEGHKLQQMPCRHYFHPDCLLQWLNDNNSCPLCLFEMPTDNSEYERRKEREREEAEERRGAENAVRGGEFLYI